MIKLHNTTIDLMCSNCSQEDREQVSRFSPHRNSCSVSLSECIITPLSSIYNFKLNLLGYSAYL